MRGDFEFSTRLTLIQQLIPLGLMAVEEILQKEVTHLAGEPIAEEEAGNVGVVTQGIFI